MIAFAEGVRQSGYQYDLPSGDAIANSNAFIFSVLHHVGLDLRDISIPNDYFFGFPGLGTLLGSASSPVIAANQDLDQGVALLGRNDLSDTLIGTEHADSFWGEQDAASEDPNTFFDTVSYESSSAGVTVRLLLAEPPNVGSGIGAGGDAEGDEYHGIENVIGSSSNDLLIGDPLASPLSGIRNTLDGRAGDDILEGGRNADALIGGDGIDTASYQSSDEPISVDLGAGIGSGGHAEGDQYFGIENVVGSEHNDVIRGNAENNKLDGGGGIDLVDGGGGADEIFLGDGADVLFRAGPGSVIHTGPGGEGDQDTILFSPGTLVTDADGWDRILLAGDVAMAELVVANGNSESPWAYGLGDLVKVGFSTDGEMVLGYGWETDRDKWMYLANGNNDPLADSADLTAGIRVGSVTINSWRLLDLPPGISNEGVWDLMRPALKDFFAEARVGGSDPLVLDLDGDGLELRAVTASGPQFDVDGDQFAEPTGWVAADDGLLAIDRNADGIINEVSELFGNADQSGFAALATLYANGDGAVDASDSGFGDLRIWQDLDQDGATDAGELRTLDEVGIASIGLAATDDGTSNALNVVMRLGTFTWADGTTGTVGDIEFRINNFNTTYAGDTSVDPALVSGMPNLKGHGTLADLHVALTLEGANGQLSQAISATMPALNTINLATLRENAFAILEAWTEAPPTPANVPANPDTPVKVSRSEDGLEVLDFAVEVTEEVTLGDGSTATMTFWRLASGAAVTDAQGDVIDHPSFADVVAQTVADADVAWEVLSGAELDYLERFYGEEIPIEDPRALNSGAVGGLSELLAQSVHLMELQALRLAMQGPLEPYFAGVTYDAGSDRFVATTDRQLVPMFEAIFDAAPGDTAGATDWLQSWEPLIDSMLADYHRGGTLEITYPFMFATIVAAAENTGFVLDPKAAAVALGIPGDMIITGSGSIAGSDTAEIFYLSAGDDTVVGAGGADVYAVGRNFGNDTIDDHEELAQHSYDVLRFAHHDPADVTLYRDGLDMRIVDNTSGETITILGQFHNITPSLSGSNLGPEQGVDEVIFPTARSGPDRTSPGPFPIRWAATIRSPAPITWIIWTAVPATMFCPAATMVTSIGSRLAMARTRFRTAKAISCSIALT